MEYTIYKIVCKDENITDCYVGSTKDFNKRQIKHKSVCNDSNCKVYNFINENGGFDNFNFEVIETLICENKNEVLIRERFWIEKLEANLNKIIPSRQIKEYIKSYYVKNKETINEKKKSKIICSCGSIINYNSKARHEKTKKHQDYLSSLPTK